MNPKTSEFVVSVPYRTDFYTVSRNRIPKEAAIRAARQDATFYKVTPNGRTVNVKVIEKNGRFYLRSL